MKIADRSSARDSMACFCAPARDQFAFLQLLRNCAPLRRARFKRLLLAMVVPSRSLLRSSSALRHNLFLPIGYIAAAIFRPYCGGGLFCVLPSYFCAEAAIFVVFICFCWEEAFFCVVFRLCTAGCELRAFFLGRLRRNSVQYLAIVSRETIAEHELATFRWGFAGLDGF